MNTNDSIKKQSMHGMFWNALEYVSVQGGQFIITLVLARLLLPRDFGAIGMLAIFIAISQTFIDSGMGMALIQKKDRSELDFSTVFIYNLILSIAIYLILFLAAPAIAQFYKLPHLTALSRVLTLSIILHALTLVQNTRLTIQLNFQTIAKINVIAVLVSGSLAIYAAFNDAGVWALVVQSLGRTFTSMLLLWYFGKWKPSFQFSGASFKELFGFSSKVLGVGIAGTVFANIYKVIIGKAYTARILGFYSQGFQFAEMSSASVTNILQKVSFPILSSVQDDTPKFVATFKRYLRIAAFINFPLMVTLSLLAQPFVLVFLTDKWLPTVPLLQGLCFARLLYPITVLNNVVLNAKGRSDLFLKVDLAKWPVTIVALIITIPLGIEAVVIGHVITSFIGFLMNTFMAGKLFSYGTLGQIKDMSLQALATAAMAACVFLFGLIQTNSSTHLFLGGLIGISSYLLFAYLLKIPEVADLGHVASVWLKKKNSTNKN
ncbi:MAG: lipopolysaccharide biosynthesis protein [Bacteroidia bacterium]|nr:lipopolysaccharide biosynthesis protein [Bacteroidia bacterium]MCF8428422.1 lipopolysaccharide biosynthesis protein [Bacteroidia bacterium]